MSGREPRAPCRATGGRRGRGHRASCVKPAHATSKPPLQGRAGSRSSGRDSRELIRSAAPESGGFEAADRIRPGGRGHCWSPGSRRPDPSAALPIRAGCSVFERAAGAFGVSCATMSFSGLGGRLKTVFERGLKSGAVKFTESTTVPVAETGLEVCQVSIYTSEIRISFSSSLRRPSGRSLPSLSQRRTSHHRIRSRRPTNPTCWCKKG